MTHSYASLFYHLIWSTKDRHPWIQKDIQLTLYKYIAGIISNLEGQLMEIGGMPDHVHLLVNLKPRTSIPELVRSIKNSSTKWIRQQPNGHSAFTWQEGYGIFSVSFSNIEAVRKYIKSQEEHHRNHTFENEYLDLLNKVKIHYDSRFVLG